MTALPHDAPDPGAGAGGGGGSGRERLAARVAPADHLHLIPPAGAGVGAEVALAEPEPGPLLAGCPYHTAGYRQALKRLLDLILSLLVLLAAAPLMLLLALAIKLDSPGPVFYTQERVGLGGRCFRLLKFRSMTVDAEAATGPVFATRDDPRTTTVGRVMRRLSLDELPQFINVLRGEMSVVGPRPERPHFVGQFSQAIPGYAERHAMKAGITGWAQVNGLRGATSIEERTGYDLAYIAGWSLRLDLKIVLLTARQIVRGENAY